MKIKKYLTTIETKEYITFYDLTPKIETYLQESELKNGMVFIHSMHTTSAIKIMEDEALLKNDIKNFLAKLAPQEGIYYHDEIQKREVPVHERINAYSHLRSLILNTSETVPFCLNKLELGEWQKIMLVENDPGRSRKILIIIMGE